MSKAHQDPPKTALPGPFKPHTFPLRNIDPATGLSDIRMRMVDGTFTRLTPAQARLVYVQQMANSAKPPDPSALKRWKTEAQKLFTDQAGAEKSRANYVAQRVKAYLTPASTLERWEAEAQAKYPDDETHSAAHTSD